MTTTSDYVAREALHPRARLIYDAMTRARRHPRWTAALRILKAASALAALAATRALPMLVVGWLAAGWLVDLTRFAVRAAGRAFGLDLGYWYDPERERDSREHPSLMLARPALAALVYFPTGGWQVLTTVLVVALLVANGVAVNLSRYFADQLAPWINESVLAEEAKKSMTSANEALAEAARAFREREEEENDVKSDA